MNDDTFESKAEQINRTMLTKEHVCAIDEEHATIMAKEAVVRCQNCKHFTENATPHDAVFTNWCSRLGTDYVWPEGFCAWGESKDARRQDS